MFNLSTPLGALFIIAPSALIVFGVAWAVINRYRVMGWVRFLFEKFSEEQAKQKKDYESTWD